MPNAYRRSAAHRIAGRTAGLVCALVVCELTARAAPPPSAEQAAEMRGHAVELARAGDYDDALALLGQVRRAMPNDRGALYDETAILGWASRDQAVLENAAAIDLGDAPRFVLEAVAKSARNLHDFATAERWYQQALASTPDDLDARLGLAMVEAEQGHADASRATLAPLADEGDDARRIDLTRAYVERISGEPFTALRYYERLLSREPDDAEALRGKVLVLRALLLPTQALALAREHPGILSAAELDRLNADETAIRVRFAARTPYPPELAEQEFARTLAALDRAAAATTDPATELALSSDRVVALEDQNRCTEAIADFEALEPGGRQILPYVLTAAGRAYLDCREPERAVEILERAARAAPDDPEPKFALIYAYFDLERPHDALALAESLRSSSGAPSRAPGAPASPADADALRAEIVSALAEAYADRLASAERRFERLLDEAPANGELRRELANIYRWRGWRDRALYEYRQVLSQAPPSLYTRVGYAETLLEANEFEPLPDEIAALEERYPRNPQVAQLARRWAVHEKSELEVETSTGNSSGSTFGSKQYSVDTTWHTRPLRPHFRGSVRLHDAFAEFPEGDGRRRRIGLGMEYRGPDWLASGELTGDRVEGGQPGLGLGVDRRLGDFWTLGASLAIDSDEAQLRAVRAGIRTDDATVTARFAPDESQSVRFGWRYQALTDGNRGRRLFAEARTRVVNRPRSKLELTAELDSGGNRSNDVPYYSPSHEASWLLGLDHEWRIYRRYERSLVQQLTIAAGRREQTSFPSGAIWQASYRLRWQASDTLALGIGVDRNSMFYDGAREHGTFVVANIEARL